MSTAMLPRLHEDKNVQQWVGKRWSRVGSLKEIADAIDCVDSNSPENRFSIPDTYEKAIRFTSLIKNHCMDEEDALPYEIIQWRSLLTILALQGIKGFPVTFRKIDCGEYRNDFIGALKLQPEESLLKGYSVEWSWMPFYVMRYAGSDIGVFSPSTLLYPVVEMEEKIFDSSELSWFDEKKHIFLKPQDYLSEEEKIIVCAWLLKLNGFLEMVRDQGNAGRGTLIVDPELLGTLMNHVRKYQNVLMLENREKVSRKAKKLTESWQWISRENGCFQTNGYGLNVASVLNVTIAPRMRVGEKSIELGSVFAEKILYFKGQFPFSGCMGAESYRLQNYSSWSNVEDAGMEEGAYALLPFSGRMLDILASSGRDMVEKFSAMVRLTCRSEFDSSGKRDYILAEADLEILDEGNFKVSKKFYVTENEENNQVICANEDSYAFLLHIWPNIRLESWKAYYTYFKHETIGETAVTYEVVFPEAVGIKIGTYSIKSEEYPKAYGFLRNGIFVGMVLPVIPKETEIELASRAVVAVDFGTTGTKMFAQVNGREEEIYLEDENIATIIDYAVNPVSRETSLRSEFIPDKKPGKEQKLFSVYQYFSRKNMLDVLLDGNIFLPDNTNELLDREDGDAKNGRIQLSNVATNLKWRNEATKKYLTVFLLQICLQTTVLLLKKYNVSVIEWRFSVPSSMVKEQIQSIRNTWNNVRRELNAFTGISHIIFENELDLFEGYMASFYFSSVNRGNYVQGFFSIDIGGGTTDIALWKKRENSFLACMQLSLRIAGRRMLTTAVWDYADEFSKLVRGNAGLESNFQAIVRRKTPAARSPRDDENAVIDKIIAAHGELIKDLIHMHAGEIGWIRKFQARLSMNIAMLFFCLGKMMAEAIFTGRYEIEKNNRATFWICVGGNGSGILDWISVSDWEKLDEELRKPYINMFRASRAYEMERLRVERNKEDPFSSGRMEKDWTVIERQRRLDQIEVQIYKSEQPKEEVARGLLKISSGIIRDMKTEKMEKIPDIDRELLGGYTEEFLDLYKEEFSSMHYFEELVDEKVNGEREKINSWDRASIQRRIDELFRYNKDGENDASSSRDMYDCLMDYVLADFLIEDIRPGR